MHVHQGCALALLPDLETVTSYMYDPISQTTFEKNCRGAEQQTGYEMGYGPGSQDLASLVLTDA